MQLLPACVGPLVCTANLLPPGCPAVRVCFYARQSEPFSPATPGERGLGGSESALYYLARELASLGHEVTVLNHCGDDGGLYDGVMYLDIRRHRHRWQPLLRATPPELLVLFRRMLDVAAPLPGRVRVFWAHDFQGVSADYPRGRLARLLAIQWRRFTGPAFYRRIHYVVAVSQFLADQFRYLFRVPANKLLVMPNGVDVDMFATSGSDCRDPYRLVYTSVPDRGLDILLARIFPAIKREIPQATLHVFSYRSLEPYRGLAADGVVLGGSLSKSRLAQELLRSSLLVYPCTVEELGAIAVLEAMAAGVPAVTSTLGVLPELVGDRERGIAVPGDPRTQPFAERFVHEVVMLLRQQDQLQRMRVRAQDWVRRERSWASVARRWEATLLGGRTLLSDPT